MSAIPDAPVNAAARWLPFAFAALFALMAVGLIRNGALFEDWQPASGALVGRALLGAAGKMTVGELIAAYPPLAMAPMIGLHHPAALVGTNPGELFSALLGAAVAGLWLGGLLRAGYRRGAAVVLVLLLVGNPLFLGAITAAPGAMLTMLAVWMFAMSAFTLRSRGSVNDLIACSVALALLVFAGPLGCAFAFATLPFLLLLMPSDVPPRSTLSVYLVLLFPALFGLAGFMFTNWMMVHDPLGFLHTDIDLAGHRFGESWLSTIAAVLFAVICAPALLGLFIAARGRRPLQAVASALLGTLLLSVALALQSGASHSSIETLSPAVALAAAAATRWPRQEARLPHVGLLLALGVIGGTCALLAQGALAQGETGGAQASEFTAVRRTVGDQYVGHFLAGRAEVMIDAAAHPAVVAARGNAEGLVTSNDTAFALSLLRKRVETPTIAVAAPNPAGNADAISRSLPDLYAYGEPGMQLVYDHDGWRVWTRNPVKGPMP